MHELSLCQNILEIVIEKLGDKNDSRVKTIYLEMGELAAIEKSALLFSFEVIKKGTVAEHAVLKIINIPGQAWCEFCNKKINVKQYYEPCPFCNNFLTAITDGKELRIKSMEVE